MEEEYAMSPFAFDRDDRAHEVYFGGVLGHNIQEAPRFIQTQKSELIERSYVVSSFILTSDLEDFLSKSKQLCFAAN